MGKGFEVSWGSSVLKSGLNVGHTAKADAGGGFVGETAISEGLPDVISMGVPVSTPQDTVRLRGIRAEMVMPVVPFVKFIAA
jgi:hypothetical protein